ncbi:MAG: hypothetical protein V3R98_04260 [Alphaproteobacteria bacterium]
MHAAAAQRQPQIVALLQHGLLEPSEGADILENQGDPLAVFAWIAMDRERLLLAGRIPPIGHSRQEERLAAALGKGGQLGLVADQKRQAVGRRGVQLDPVDQAAAAAADPLGAVQQNHAQEVVGKQPPDGLFNRIRRTYRHVAAVVGLGSGMGMRVGYRIVRAAFALAVSARRARTSGQGKLRANIHHPLAELPEK